MKIQILFLSILFSGFASLNAQTTMNIYQSNGTVLQIPISSIDSITYTVNNPGNLATLTTLPIGSITSTSATSGGSISATLGSSVTQRGICWSTSQNPTTANSSTNDGNGTGSFTSILTGLAANTTYYVRAYAINSAGTAYGNQQSFSTTNSGIYSSPGAGVTYNGYTYGSIVFGNGQEWMSENLRSTNYSNGDPIPTDLDDASWAATTDGAFSIYNNDFVNIDIYGMLYNWYAVADARNVCPVSWHVPTEGEFNTLINYLGGESIAGGKLKTIGLQNWYEPNQDATNESGFSGLPSGTRSNSGYNLMGYSGYWWSSSESSSAIGLHLWLSWNSGVSLFTGTGKKLGFSVRCLKD